MVVRTNVLLSVSLKVETIVDLAQPCKKGFTSSWTIDEPFLEYMKNSYKNVHKQFMNSKKWFMNSKKTSTYCSHSWNVHEFVVLGTKSLLTHVQGNFSYLWNSFTLWEMMSIIVHIYVKLRFCFIVYKKISCINENHIAFHFEC